MLGIQVLWTVIKIVIMIFFILNVAAVLTWADRRQSAMIQDRIGPNRAVIKVFGKEIRLLGLLHPAADGVKFFFKEDFMPPKADVLLFSLAPILCVFAVLAVATTIPFGDTVCLGPDLWHTQWSCAQAADGTLLHAGLDQNNVRQCMDSLGNVSDVIHPLGSREWGFVPRYGVCGLDPRQGIVPIDLAVAPLNVGILFVFAMAGQGIIGAAIAGWSSDNKFSLMGALRAASQMVSYEVTMGMSLIGAMMIYGTVRLDDMVRWQGENTWGIFVQPFAFFLFFAAAVAESKRIPFDLPEAESELVSGYFTEYSGMKFGMFYLSEYMEVVTSSLLITVIFLGGWNLPFVHRDGITIAFGDNLVWQAAVPHFFLAFLGPLAFFGKALVVCFLQTFVRWSLPRFRYDQLMKLGWRVLLPASLANILVTGCIYLAIDHAGAAASYGLKVAADVTQGLVAVVITVLLVRAIAGFVSPVRHNRVLVGSSASQAARAGGTKSAPMQA
jgi:NADH-quinone oxidoreductase subunit H